jgi:hypothetical protein
MIPVRCGAYIIFIIFYIKCLFIGEYNGLVDGQSCKIGSNSLKYIQMPKTAFSILSSDRCCCPVLFLNAIVSLYWRTSSLILLAICFGSLSTMQPECAIFRLSSFAIAIFVSPLFPSPPFYRL